MAGADGRPPLPAAGNIGRNLPAAFRGEGGDSGHFRQRRPTGGDEARVFYRRLPAAGSRPWIFRPDFPAAADGSSDSRPGFPGAGGDGRNLPERSKSDVDLRKNFFLRPTSGGNVRRNLGACFPAAGSDVPYA